MSVNHELGHAGRGSEERLNQAELLLSVARTVASYETIDEMLAALVELTTREIHADRGTIFLNDAESGELYSRVAQGNYQREIRILNNSGIAGHVFSSGESLIVDDAYADPRFNRLVDEKTGYMTRNILCVPMKTMRGAIFGVAQILNKIGGAFTPDDRTLLESMTTQAAIALQSMEMVERMNKFRQKELEFFDVVSSITSEIDLGMLLQKVMSEATRMLNAERSTLFLNDEKRQELFSKVGEGLDGTVLRMPNQQGIAGAVFASGKTINIPHAYADLRFNPAFDKRTGFFTRSILCVPLMNKGGKVIGVTQVINKRGGVFNADDESRLKAFTAQVSITLENAKLFDDIQNMKNYSESMLESMSNGVVTLNEDGQIITCNSAGLRILKMRAADILEKPGAQIFNGKNTWILEKIQRVGATKKSKVILDVELEVRGTPVAVNLTMQPLIGVDKKSLGVMIILEDITSEKRMRSTMARYMDPALAEQVLAAGAEILGGKSMTATVMFSDIRGFTALTEELGAQGTVALLNEYFTIMVDCIQAEGGMLDKFIGDAIMAAFGVPVAHDDDEDRAVRTAIAMIRSLRVWNAERATQGKKMVEMGIGLHTDIIVSGNIGSPKRMDYTLIGDGVNLASRLEGLCKTYHTSILISESTYQRLRQTFRTREVDRVVVKGKTETVGIYEVLDYHTLATFPNLMEVLLHFKEGRAQYQQRCWDKAAAAFGASLRLNPKDDLSRIYIERCARLAAAPPPANWDGAWIMDSK